MNAAEKLMMDRDETTVVLFVCTDTIKPHDITTEADRPTQHSNQLHEHAGSDFHKKGSQRSTAVCLGVLCALLLLAIVVLCVNFIKETNLLQIERDKLNNKNITQEGDELRAKYNNVTEQNKQLNQTKNELLKYLHDGWKYYESSLYYFSSEKKSWSESRRYCRARGADLVIINNKQEQDFVKKISDSEGHWIGLSDSAVEGRWTWVDGSALTYSSWVYSEPDGQRRENCAASYTMWYDYSCDSDYKRICEKSIN